MAAFHRQLAVGGLIRSRSEGVRGPADSRLSKNVSTRVQKFGKSVGQFFFFFGGVVQKTNIIRESLGSRCKTLVGVRF